MPQFLNCLYLKHCQSSSATFGKPMSSTGLLVIIMVCLNGQYKLAIIFMLFGLKNIYLCNYRHGWRSGWAFDYCTACRGLKRNNYLYDLHLFLLGLAVLYVSLNACNSRYRNYPWSPRLGRIFFNNIKLTACKVRCVIFASSV